MNGFQKLLQAQQKLNAPKDKYNPFGKYNYRSCESILEAVKPLLNEFKLSLVIDDSIEIFGSRIYVKATAYLYDSETGELIVKSSAYAREDDDKKGMDAAQLTGSTSSYARKYALNGLFAIDDSKDADTPEQKKEIEEKSKQQEPQPKPAPTKPAPQKPNSRPATKVELTEEQLQLKDELEADIDNAESMNSLKASMALATGQPFEAAIKEKAKKKAIEKGWYTPKA